MEEQTELIVYLGFGEAFGQELIEEATTYDGDRKRPRGYQIAENPTTFEMEVTFEFPEGHDGTINALFVTNSPDKYDPDPRIEHIARISPTPNLKQPCSLTLRYTTLVTYEEEPPTTIPQEQS